MKVLILFFLITSYYLSASDLKNNYTIILANTKNIENAKIFINRNIKEQKEPIFIFKSAKYYVTTYGIYNSKNEVYQAIKSLPTNLKNKKPYSMTLSYDLYKAVKINSNLVYFKGMEKQSSQTSAVQKNSSSEKILMDLVEQTQEYKKDETNKIDSFSLGIGQNKLENNVLRIAIQRNFGNILYENKYGYLSGFFDLSLSKWSYSDNVYGIAISPVFAYYFNTNSKKIKPFIYGGIGATLISNISTDKKDFSTHFQLEDRIGLGLQFESYELSLGYFHYSNGGIKKPNDGMDIFLLSITYKF